MRSIFIASIIFFLFLCKPAASQNTITPTKVKEKLETTVKDSISKEIKKLEAKEKSLTKPNVKDTIIKDLKKLEAKDVAKTEKFLKKLKKKLSFASNARAKEQKRIDAIIKKYVQDENLLSGADVKKINDSLSKVNISKLDSLGKLIASLKTEKDNLTNKFGNLQQGMDALAESIPEPAEELEMDKLADKMIPLIKEKAKEEKLKEEKEKKLKIIRSLINHPEGVKDTMEINDSISKAFTLRLKKKEVFGFHPYWRNEDFYRNYNFSVLSSIIYYGYELDPKTGLFLSNHDWEKQNVTDHAKKENCKVYLGVYCENEKGIKALLSNNKSQEKFANSIIDHLKLKNANGVNLIFGSPAGNNRLKFLKFIKFLHNKLLAADPDYKITLTIPALDKNFFYDLKGLDAEVEYFVIDFTKKNVRGPIVPITGTDYSLESGLSRYFSTNVDPQKFIPCFPYHGVVWDAEFDLDFIDYIAYSEIEEAYIKEYGFIYDNGTQRTDVVFDKIDTLEQLWFDDAKTLSEKYDYVLNKGVSGVGVWALGDDGFKPELWEALINKMIIIDTTNVTEIKIIPPKQHEKTFWEKIKYELHLYRMLFEHPCDFEKKGESGVSQREEMVLDDCILWIVICSLLLLIIIGVFSIIKNRTLGDDWPRRKLFLSLLIILTVLNMITILMFCFLSEDFKGFGAIDSEACEVNFVSLLKLLGIGFILGGFSMRFLIMPLIKRKEIP